MKIGKGFAQRTAERETENFDEINRIQKVAVGHRATVSKPALGECGLPSKQVGVYYLRIGFKMKLTD